MFVMYMSIPQRAAELLWIQVLYKILVVGRHRRVYLRVLHYLK